jgi:hypothetical protein
VNAIFEALMSPSERKPTQFSTSNERADYIRKKYVHHKYLDVANYAFCKTRRTQSVVMEDDESIASDIFSAFATPSPASISKSYGGSYRNLTSPNSAKLFFTPCTPFQRAEEDVEEEVEEEDMFADSATTTSDLFGPGSTTPMRNRSRSSDVSAIDEGMEEEDCDDERTEEGSQKPYPQLKKSVSTVSAFTFESTFRTDGDANCPPGPLQRVQAPLVQAPNLDMKTLKRQKEEAIEREDYMRAAQIKRQMAALLQLPTCAEIESLESLKKLAVRQEDYVRAAELKTRIEHLRNQSRSDRHRQVELSMNQAMAFGNKEGTTTRHRNSLDNFFGACGHTNDDFIHSAIDNERMRPDKVDDIEAESIQLDTHDNISTASFQSPAENVSQRFSRSIAETSQHSMLDSMGFVVNDDGPTTETSNFRSPASKDTGSSSSSSRRLPRTPVRDPTRDPNGMKKSRSRSRARREKSRRSSKTKDKNETKDIVQSRAGKFKDDKQHRNRSSSQDKKSDKINQQGERCKSRETTGRSKDEHSQDTSKSRGRNSHHNDRESRDRSKSRDRKSYQKDKQRGEKSKSNHQMKSRDRSKNSEIRNEEDKPLRARSKSREKQTNEKQSDLGRGTTNMMESTVSRPRSKSRSRSRRDTRQKIGVNKAPCNTEVKRSTSLAHPTCGLPFSTPVNTKSKVLSTSTPTCNFSPFSPEAVARDSSHRGRAMGATDIEKPFPDLKETEDDISIDESFKTFSSDNVQSAHQRSSSGRVSMSRRNLGCDNKSYEVSPKGSHSLHVTRGTLEESSFDFGAVQSENFFALQPPISSPSLSNKSSSAPRRSVGFETPAKPFSKRQLSIGSPAGVEDFPSMGTSEKPNKKDSDFAAKYKQEVERTVARLERLREKRRNQGVSHVNSKPPEIMRTATKMWD